MALYATLVEAIDSYTGLTPVAFFTILALVVGAYRLVSGMFVAPETPQRKVVAPAEPVQMGDMTLEELRAFDGSDPKKPLLMGIKGQIYDVSRSRCVSILFFIEDCIVNLSVLLDCRMFYGPGGPYALFAGRDASRALALMSFDQSDLTGNLDGLSAAEMEVLQDWELKFMEKYVKVGQLVGAGSTVTQEDGDGAAAAPISPSAG